MDERRQIVEGFPNYVVVSAVGIHSAQFNVALQDHDLLNEIVIPICGAACCGLAMWAVEGVNELAKRISDP